MNHYTIEVADDRRYFNQRMYVTFRNLRDLTYHNTYNAARNVLDLIMFQDKIFEGILTAEVYDGSGWDQ